MQNQEKSSEETKEALKTFTVSEDFQNEIQKMEERFTSFKDESKALEERLQE